jgi:hypothetical protein
MAAEHGGRSFRDLAHVARAAAHKGFHLAGELTTRQQDAPAAPAASNADVSTQPDNFPLHTSTRVRFPHAYHIAQANVLIHDLCLARAGIGSSPFEGQMAV